MHMRMYERYLARHFELIVTERQGDHVVAGELRARDGSMTAPVRNHIPRFGDNAYCESFAFQWERFTNLQHDSVLKDNSCRQRIQDCTHWPLDEIAGRSLIECGCGPGRFTETFLSLGLDVVAVDMSDAVDVNLRNSGLRDNLLLIQADATSLAFLHGMFDLVFCYGVLQHTPDPRATFHKLVRYLRPGGCISIDVYRKFYTPNPWALPKYIWRPLAKRLRHETLLKILRWYIPRYIDFDTRLRANKKHGDLMVALIPIPCWNYLDPSRPREERIEHAILATFDALSPAHDHPLTLNETRAMFRASSLLTDIRVEYGANGVVGNARRAEEQRPAAGAAGV
ncbi:MAG: hypothetical protein AUJ49_01175 [Desulfovibrionaceae bacterium CG1_02_65_16]|nr:MAG: hypothetical protein AUJ49_01175 [Desulfovibrionaceae bacterium CG1_02_65_16]